MSLKIIGGTLRGRPLKSPRTKSIRPTTGILRKSVFDICKEAIEGAQFLDLFAGTGAIGIEALSRGAAHATFVDQDREALLCIRENVQKLQLEEKATIIRGHVMQVIRRLDEQKKSYDLIYIDPPYGNPLVHLEILSFLDGSTLAERATVFIEEAAPSRWEREKIPLKRLACKDARRFGRSILFQYKQIF